MVTGGKNLLAIWYDIVIYISEMIWNEHDNNITILNICNNGYMQHAVKPLHTSWGIYTNIQTVLTNNIKRIITRSDSLILWSLMICMACTLFLCFLREVALLNPLPPHGAANGDFKVLLQTCISMQSLLVWCKGIIGTGNLCTHLGNFIAQAGHKVGIANSWNYYNW